MFDNVLSRADEEVLQGLLGNKVLKLVGRMDPSLLTPSRIREVVVSQKGRDGLLLSDFCRNQIFLLLRPNEAEQLSNMIGKPKGVDPYTFLGNQKFRKKSHLDSLFNYFGVTPPLEIASSEQPSNQIVNANYPLFEHQITAAHKVNQALNQEPHRVLLHMPTGAGKTRTAMNVIAEHLRFQKGKIVVWLAHSEELCEQAAREFKLSWEKIGNRDVSLHRYWGNHNINLEELNEGLVVAGMSKIYSKTKKSLGFISRLGSFTTLVIIDEAHQAIAPTYKLVLDALVSPFPGTSLLGLSATPGRSWSDVSSDEQLANFFGQRKVELKIEGYSNPIDYLVENKYLAKAAFSSLFYGGANILNDDDLRQIEENFKIPDRILLALGVDEVRNLRIVGAVEGLLKRHNKILLFATSVENSNILSSALQVRGVKSYSITGTTPPHLRNKFIEDFKNEDDGCRVLCNYGVLTTGFDAPKTSAAIIARPTISLVLYSQMVGRVIRGTRVGGNDNAEILTVVDSELPGFGDIAEAFHNWEDVWREES
ncbi:DEAD/DEAH box helicase [Geopsychrobacter electrodiphilus]|uniref:DEAD/DEAH box helicase n=1 Tax=Geopsychrobacter electrodiphilus TaxID=225196 RepID=UPI000374616E|nr:DEAD/DEAH box helicase [Geopsychrobacter electrodiphilus]